jgi:hypothetical protein
MKTLYRVTILAAGSRDLLGGHRSLTSAWFRTRVDAIAWSMPIVSSNIVAGISVTMRPTVETREFPETDVEVFDAARR